ncbi:MAG: plasma-membrane proton-efflux P-type ATPase [Deltaproteobacteria bacterium]|nr:plasma-membrane proton-efflux P-type ATPase [Deltaproteobacteria bacterium]
MSKVSLFNIEEVEKLSVEEALEGLKSTRGGLSDRDAKERLVRFGPNAIEEKRVHPLVKIMSYFWGPIPWMIEAAALLSAFVKDWPDLSIILVLLVVNAVIGFWQENKADNAIALLKKKLALQARVIRNGKWETLPAGELVPGDVIRIRLGDIVPADLKLLEGDYLEVDQSALTGESLPVEKHASDAAYSGSIVRRGEMDGVVAGTGMNTFFGKTARLVQEAHNVSHYQQAVLRIGHFLIMLTLALVAVILSVALFRHTPMLETLEFCLILTVAAIPVAMPAVLSVAMAVGAVQLARRQAIVSRLVAIEEMAGMDILCSDKTGTLTQNRLKVGDPVTTAHVSPEELIDYAALASRAEDNDPIDEAIFEKQQGGKYTLSDCHVDAFNPFDPVIKRTEATVSRGDERFKVSKGAPQVILALCRDEEDGLRKRVEIEVTGLAEKGYRALGIGRTDAEGAWRFMGLLPLSDPPRDDSVETIETARKMGVTVKMVTGDHLAIAKEIARQLHLGQNILPAAEAFGEEKTILSEQVEEADGFSQVFPEHKYRIVESLQDLKHFVGMTGDGVNDAPALKKADIGIAVSGATDAARSAADLVLTAPGLSVIAEAIKESRKIFERMTSYSIYRIAETIRVLLFMTSAIFIFDFYPVTAVMIILLALLNDGPIMMIAYDRVPVADAPVRWDMHKVLTLSAVLGVLGVISSFGMFWIGEQILRLDRETIRTLMFLKLTVAGHMTIYLARTGHAPFWRRPFPAPALFWTSETTQLAATLVAVYGVFMNPIGWKLAGLIWAYALVWFLFNDFVKVQTYRLIDHAGKREHKHLDRIHLSLHNHRH